MPQTSERGSRDGRRDDRSRSGADTQTLTWITETGGIVVRSAGDAVTRIGIDVVALKPAGCDVARATRLPIDRVVIDWEGSRHLPTRDTLADLAGSMAVRVTIPVRADGFNPLGDDRLYDQLPDAVNVAIVAGHPAYLSRVETRRSIAPRLDAALERHPDAWVGTEGMETVALATGATQFDLLSGSTERRVRALRGDGFTGDIAVYAPTVLSGEPTTVLDGVGDYVARRDPVSEALPADAATDGGATGRAREVLESACADYALVGDAETVRDRVVSLREAGVDHIVAHPALGIDVFIE